MSNGVRFEINANNGKSVKPGKYIALVAQWVRPDGTPPNPLDHEEGMVDRRGAFRNLLPATYNNKNQSPLVVEIVRGHNDVPTLALTTDEKSRGDR